MHQKYKIHHPFFETKYFLFIINFDLNGFCAGEWVCSLIKRNSLSLLRLSV